MLGEIWTQLLDGKYESLASLADLLSQDADTLEQLSNELDQMRNSKTAEDQCYLKLNISATFGKIAGLNNQEEQHGKGQFRSRWKLKAVEKPPQMQIEAYNLYGKLVQMNITCGGEGLYSTVAQSSIELIFDLIIVLNLCGLANHVVASHPALSSVIIRGFDSIPDTGPGCKWLALLRVCVDSPNIPLENLQQLLAIKESISS